MWCSPSIWVWWSGPRWNPPEVIPFDFPPKKPEEGPDEPPPLCIDPDKTYVAKLTTSHGPIEITLDTQKTPNTANNYVVLSRYHYYDGTVITRIDDEDHLSRWAATRIAAGEIVGWFQGRMEFGPRALSPPGAVRRAPGAAGGAAFPSRTWRRRGPPAAAPQPRPPHMLRRRQLRP